MRVPSHIIKLIYKLYKNCTHFIRRQGITFVAFDIINGILQGCPLSATLFDVALDPLLRQILHYIPYNPLLPMEVLVAYLDDIAMVLSNIFTQFPLLLMIFELFKRANGCSLNFKKCIIIPLWTADLAAAAAKIRALLPQSANFRIDLAGELLGVWIGPGAEGRGFDDIHDKVIMRTGMVKQFQLGMWGSIREYNTNVFSCFSHINQFFAPPPNTLILERKLHQRLMGTPSYAATTAMLSGMKDIFHFPTNLHTLLCEGFAAKWRVANVTSK